MVVHPPAGGWDGSPAPRVVLVHGALDRAASFGRTARRLRDTHEGRIAVVAYDRRGYGGSRALGPAPLRDHAADLLAVVDGLGPPAPRAPVVVIGHSQGGDVALAAAVRGARRLSAVGVFEAPLPWFGFRRARSQPPAAVSAPTNGHGAVDAAGEAERFFRRMVGDGAWERLSTRARAERQADGPALVADLEGLWQPAPFSAAQLRALLVPLVVGRGGPASAEHHRAAMAWLAAQVPGARMVEIDRASHGAHLSHPMAFAAFVEATLDAARGAVDRRS